MRGCIPDPVNNVVGSSRGTRLAPGMTEWPRSVKWAMYAALSAAVPVMAMGQSYR